VEYINSVCGLAVVVVYDVDLDRHGRSRIVSIVHTVIVILAHRRELVKASMDTFSLWSSDKGFG
jgi:hypothetical protein